MKKRTGSLEKAMRDLQNLINDRKMDIKSDLRKLFNDMKDLEMLEEEQVQLDSGNS